MRRARNGTRLGVGAALLAAAVLSTTAPTAEAASPATAGAVTTDAAAAPTGWVLQRLSSPSRVVVRDDTGALATFTTGARTVTLRGPARTFKESTTTTTVTTTTWVRLSDQPFAGRVPRAWLEAALADTSPDLLAIASQYVTGAPTVRSTEGRIIASDAEYGPLGTDGGREEGSDFNDYLGLDWTYPDPLDATAPPVTDPAEANQIGALDCSGYVRMVFGYRSGLPLSIAPDGSRLPRRSHQMLASAPGVVTIPDTGVVPSAKKLAAGDLVFFDASTDDGSAIDHVGIYLGVDNLGAPRFVSSRKTVNGPTLGDVGGRSTLSGAGLYATAWRAARRL